MSTFPGFDRPLNQYKVSELKNFLRSRSLKVGGLKKVLIKRLKDALKKEKEKENDSDDESVIQQDPPKQKANNTAANDENQNKNNENQTKNNENQTTNDADNQSKNDVNKNGNKNEEKSNTNTTTKTIENADETEKKPNKSPPPQPAPEPVAAAVAEADKSRPELAKPTTKPQPPDSCVSISNKNNKKEKTNLKIADNNNISPQIKAKANEKPEPETAEKIHKSPEPQTIAPKPPSNEPKPPSPDHQNATSQPQETPKSAQQIQKPPQPQTIAPKPQPQPPSDAYDQPNHHHSDRDKEAEAEARDKKLAAMRARLLREKLLKQQKSHSNPNSKSHTPTNTATAPIAPPTNSVTTKHTKKRSVRDFEVDSENNPSHKRRRLNNTDKNPENNAATQSPPKSPKHTKTSNFGVGARIVIQSSLSDTSRLYIPPHQRDEEEAADVDVDTNMDLNDSSHDIKHTADSQKMDTVAGCALFIDGFRRPLQTKKVQQELDKYGAYKSFRMNAIKSHCFVIYVSSESADKCKGGMNDMFFPPNIPQIHAGKLQVKHVKMVEAMTFIMAGNNMRDGKSGNAQRPRPRSFDTKQLRHGTGDVRMVKEEKVRVAVKRKSKTPSELFKMTQCKPFVFWQVVGGDERAENEQRVKVLGAEEMERYKMYTEQQQKAQIEKEKERAKRERAEKEKEKERQMHRHREKEKEKEREMHKNRERDRERHVHRREERGGNRRRVISRGDNGHFGGRRGGYNNYRGRRDMRYNNHRRDYRDRYRDRRDMRGRRRERDRDRRSRRKFRESESSESESESDSDSDSESSECESDEGRGKGKGRREDSAVQTTTTTTISTLESSTKEVSNELNGVHPERLNRIEKCAVFSEEGHLLFVKNKFYYLIIVMFVNLNIADSIVFSFNSKHSSSDPPINQFLFLSSISVCF